MPPPGKIAMLPPEVREELDRRLIANGFGSFVALSEWLASLGFEISKSTIGVQSKRLARRIDAVKASTQAALAMEDATRDDADARSNAIYAQFQSGIFDALLAYADAETEEDPAERLALLTRAGKDFAAVGRGNIARNKWAVDVRAKMDAARDEIRKLATGAGVSPETMAAIDARLQGVV